MAQKRKLVPQPAGPLDKRRRPRGLTRAIRTAIDAMIFDRCTRLEACEKAEITERAFYLAMEKPEVAAYWRQQTDLLRSGERAANLHALVRVRDSDKNANASVKAVQVLEQLDQEAISRPPSQFQPGLQIVIVQGPATQEREPQLTSAPWAAEQIEPQKRLGEPVLRHPLFDQ
jgi:hypothetical protein